MKKIVCVKIGGRVVTSKDSLDQLIAEMVSLQKEFNFVLIHGGGDEVSKVSRLYGLTPHFEDGVRMTSAAEMDVVDMVLAGKMNKFLVRKFIEQGSSAVGVSGVDMNLFIGAALGEKTHTGRVLSVNNDILSWCFEKKSIPVIASVAADPKGVPLNINADEVGFEIAQSLQSETLLFISDIPGVLKGDVCIERLNPKNIHDEIENGVISGGMIPKTRSSIKALENGVHNVIIGQYEQFGSLSKLLTHQCGTVISY